MSIYIISLEWASGMVPDVTGFEKLLAVNFKWLKLTEHSYLVKSASAPIDIRNFITSSYPNIFHIFIGEMKSSAAWRGMQSSNERIKEIFDNE